MSEHTIKYRRKCHGPRYSSYRLHTDQPNGNLELSLVRQHRLNLVKKLPNDSGKGSTSSQPSTPSSFGLVQKCGDGCEKVNHLRLAFGWDAGLEKEQAPSAYRDHMRNFGR